MSPEQRLALGNKNRARILALFTEPRTTLEVSQKLKMTRPSVHRYFHQLQQEGWLKRLPQFIRIDSGHKVDLYAANNLDRLNYIPAVEASTRTFAYEGIDDALLRLMGFGKGLVKVGTRQNLDHYHKELATEGKNWNPNSQKCLGGFSYGVSAGLL
jgi:predicted transcriptional regulator